MFPSARDVPLEDVVCKITGFFGVSIYCGRSVCDTNRVDFFMSSIRAIK